MVAIALPGPACLLPIGFLAVLAIALLDRPLPAMVVSWEDSSNFVEREGMGGFQRLSDENLAIRDVDNSRYTEYRTVTR